MEGFIVLVFMFLVSYAIFKLFVPAQNTGKNGEKLVSKELKKLSEDEYYVLNSILIETKQKTVEIDHVVVSKYGIFVIETKNYYGYIYGDTYKEKWLKYNNDEIIFKNPTWQNYGHVIALSEVLNLPKEQFISLVCFSGETELRIKNGENVVNLYQLNDKILSYKKQIVFDDIIEIGNKIYDLDIYNLKTIQKHVEDIQELNIRKRELIEKEICPRCGDFLKKEELEHEFFLKCTNPKCTFKYQGYY